MNTKKLGNFGEDLACEYLVEKGYKILGRNYAVGYGELDIICRKRWGVRNIFRRSIHFVEVKTIIASDGFSPEDRVDYAKQRKLRNLCQIWLNKNHFPQDIPYQIDVIGVSIESATHKANVHYFPNAVEGV